MTTHQRMLFKTLRRLSDMRKGEKMTKLVCDVCGDWWTKRTPSWLKPGSVCCTGTCPGHYRLAEEPATPEGDAAYWRVRAEKAEDALGRKRHGKHMHGVDVCVYCAEGDQAIKERDQLRAEVGRLQAIEAAAKAWAEYYMPEDERREGSWQGTWLAQILAGRGPEGEGEAMTDLANKYLDEAEKRHRQEAIHEFEEDYDADRFNVPRCPWCGEPDHDWWEREGLQNDEGTSTIECSCGQKYTTTAHHVSKFSSVRVKP